tara:strand:+ start:368 stop:1057 length:690 start_codon:yes stop_codon:yes gene_type:complete
MLTIDSRENSALSIEVEKKAKALNIATKKEFIEVGDYVFSDVCFEAKSVVDFLGSVMSKRLWTQIDNMDRYYQTNVVIIHGDLDEGIQMVKDHVVSKMPEPARSITLRNKFLGAIGRITLDTDAKAFWVPSHREAALIITAICKMRPLDRPTIKPTLAKRISSDDVRADMLATIKGVSHAKAEALLESFGSIMEIGEHKAYNLSRVNGIGETVAKRILDALSNEDKVRI